MIKKKGVLKAKKTRLVPKGIKHTKTQPRGTQRPSRGIQKAWSLTKADTEFRKHMLATIEVKCSFPGCITTEPNKLTVSHYFGRVKKATRFDTKNCIFLCRTHHYWDKQLGWEYQRQRQETHGWDGRYTVFMIQKLGVEGFLELERLAESGMKPKVAIKLFQESVS
jgi:hypothetical protein